MKSMFSSTIAAISTPRGKGGIAVIRISGDEAVGICEKFIFPSKPLSALEARKAAFCKICDASGETLDEGIVTASKLALTGSLKGVYDSQAVTDHWYADRWFDDNTLSPEEMAELINSVTKEDVVAAAKNIKLDTVYRLLGK